MSDIESIRKQLDRGELDPAAAALDEALSKTPGDEELLALRGSRRHLQGCFQAAVEDFEAALASAVFWSRWTRTRLLSCSPVNRTIGVSPCGPWLWMRKDTSCRISTRQPG